jgi:hypothetical protein
VHGLHGGLLLSLRRNAAPSMQRPAVLAACLDRSARVPAAGGKSLVAEVLMLARLHATQQAWAQQDGRRAHRHAPWGAQQHQPVVRALMVLPYLSIGEWQQRACRRRGSGLWARGCRTQLPCSRCVCAALHARVFAALMHMPRCCTPCSV